MRITRIEIDGAAGRLTIERKIGETVIRIDGITKNAKGGEATWKTIRLSTSDDSQKLFECAESIQARSDGCRGTNSEIHDYYRLLQQLAT